jgi:branched-chain amino acid transport system substrate-binding protein
MAASEINVAGVYVSSENKTYDIDIIGRNDNEISDPANAWHAVDYLVNTAGVDYVIGGFRTEAVIPMLTNVFATASPPVPFFICGSSTQELLAGLGLLYGGGQYPVGSGTPYYTFNASTSDFYEYIFRATPFNSGFLVGLVMTYFAQLTQDIQNTMGWTWNATGTGTWPHKVKIAIVGENLTWAAPVIAGYQALVADFGGVFGWELNITRTFSDIPPVAVIDAALAAIETNKNVVILTCMSGPCGLTFGKRMGALNISAIPVGINVEAQDATYTGGWFPIYTASSYDMVYAIAEAIVATGTRDKGAVCTYLRTHCRTSTSANTCYYPDWDMVTVKGDKYGRDLPALNASQVTAIYGGLAVAGHNKTMPPYTTNDLIYGPGYATGVGVQWINGTQVGVYPNSGYDAAMGPISLPPQSTLQSVICGLYWSNSLEYPGTLDIHIPAAYQNKWSIWYP